MIDKKSVLCGICGINFANTADYEKHIFHYSGERWCGVKVLRELEKEPKLAKVVNDFRMNVSEDFIIGWETT